MLDCKPVETPMEMNHQLRMSTRERMCDKGQYPRLVGKSIYLTHTIPDIAYAVSVVSKFMHALDEKHMNAIYRIPRYLKIALGRRLLYTKNGAPTIERYRDVDWAGDQSTRKSTSGYLRFVKGNLVTCKSKKQKVVARSSAEAKFRGMAQDLCELLWIKKVLEELGIECRESMNLFCDNKAAIQIAQNSIKHDHTKHVEID
ncbi:secreted RxLR effector protein 161-like [Gastrolobium bilobum]|uniref:secreted RxLR effector protein 161-like n=1 Tax=Gastrolobium bilobum TaxID=150636 RepID=UPI002AB21AE0|nr:secreted RxLR effector protein 161-like [Gastrolobium bilobum]